MPTKTRKAKIHAQLYRLAHTNIPGGMHDIAETNHTQSTPQPMYAYAPERKHPSPQPVDRQEFTYVKQDIMRTLILSTIAIVVEVGLYWKFGR